MTSIVETRQGVILQSTFINGQGYVVDQMPTFPFVAR